MNSGSVTPTSPHHRPPHGRCHTDVKSVSSHLNLLNLSCSAANISLMLRLPALALYHACRSLYWGSSVSAMMVVPGSTGAAAARWSTGLRLMWGDRDRTEGGAVKDSTNGCRGVGHAHSDSARDVRKTTRAKTRRLRKRRTPTSFT